MEKTSEENFISHNSNKPFIRTMEDDLKKIRSGSIKNGGALSSSAPASRHQTSGSPFASTRDVSRLPSSVPQNLPVSMPSIRKAEPQTQSGAALVKKTDAAFQTEAAFQAVPEVKSEMPEMKKTESFSVAASKPESGLINKQSGLPEEKKDFTEKPAQKNEINEREISNKKIQSIKKPWEENEYLSPEARLARQMSSAGTSENSAKFNEDLVMPPPLRNFPSRSFQPEKPIKQFNPTLSMPYSPGGKNKIEEKSIVGGGSSSFFGKIIKFFLIVLIIAGIGAGIYYFTAIRPINDFLPDNASKSFIVGISEETINTDLTADITEEIKAYFCDNPKQSGIYRLIIKDKAGKKSLKIENFKDGLNIILPDIITNVLDKDYNLIVFNYPEKNYLRMGLIFKPKKEYDVSVFAGSWEPDIYKNLEPIFLGNSGIYRAEKQFDSNNYNNFKIRYLPLGVEDIALNYAIDNEKNFLLIATSKQDIFNLIDKTITGK